MGDLLTYSAYIFLVGAHHWLPHKLGRPADAPRVIVVERDQVALLIIHRLLGIVARDLERRVRRGVTLGTGNLGLQELLHDLALHTVLIAPALRGEVGQVALHIIVVRIRHVVGDTCVGVVVGAEGVRRRRHHQRNAHGDRGEGRESRPGHYIHIRRGRPIALSVNASERRRGLSDLVPRVLELRGDIGDLVEGSRRKGIRGLRQVNR